MPQPVDPGTLDWTELTYAPGVRAKVLHADPATGDRAALIELDEGASYPLHDHPGGEHALILEGEIKVGGQVLRTGDYMHTPSGAPHAVLAKTRCRFFVVTPKGVALIDKD